MDYLCSLMQQVWTKRCFIIICGRYLMIERKGRAQQQTVGVHVSLCVWLAKLSILAGIRAGKRLVRFLMHEYTVCFSYLKSVSLCPCGPGTVFYETVNEDWLISTVIYQQWLMNHYPKRPHKKRVLSSCTPKWPKYLILFLRTGPSF